MYSFDITRLRRSLLRSFCISSFDVGYYFCCIGALSGVFVACFLSRFDKIIISS